MLDDRNQCHGRARTVCGQPGWFLPQRARVFPILTARPQHCPARPAITLCIYSQGGAVQLSGLLSALTRQTLASQEWEVLVMDVGSDVEAREMTRQQITADLNGRGRVVPVKLPGVAWVRSRAAWEARGDILCFLEEYHRPAPDFLASVAQAFASHPGAGVMGGKVLPWWEQPPGPLAEMVAPLALGMRDLGESSQYLDTEAEGLSGAGLCIRRQVLLEAVASAAPAISQSEPTGQEVRGGADRAIARAAQQLGWQCRYEPTLKIHHVLANESLEKPVLLHRFEQLGRAQAAGRPRRLGAPLAWLQGLQDFCQWLIRRWRGPSPQLRRQHPALAEDLHDLQQEMLRGRARQALSRAA